MDEVQCQNNNGRFQISIWTRIEVTKFQPTVRRLIGQSSTKEPLNNEYNVFEITINLDVIRI